MTNEVRQRYDIDKDISVEMYTYGTRCYVSIYNDNKDTSIAFETSKNNLKELADFFYKHLENF
jgi:hypothetical protein